MSTTTVSRSRTKLASLGYGMGSIWQRPDGSLYHVYFDGDRQREVRLRATSLSAARKECAARNTRKDEGRLVAPTSITFAQVAEEFLAMQRGLLLEGSRSARTVALYEQRYNAHLVPGLGRRRFQQITTSHISGLLADLRKKNGRKGQMSGSTRAGILRLASAIFAFGVSRGYRTDSPVQYLAPQERPVSKPSTKARALTDEECSRLIAKTRPRLRAFVAFLAYTGVRLSRASDCGGVISTSTRERSRSPPSSSAGSRGRFPPSRASRLRTATAPSTSTPRSSRCSVTGVGRQWRGLHRSDCFVFCTEDGRPLSHRNTARDIEAAAKKASLNGDGLRPVSAHMLRHTFASRLIALGLDVVEVARQLGDKPDTLLRVYAQAFTDARRRDEIRERIAQGTNIALGG